MKIHLGLIASIMAIPILLLATTRLGLYFMAILHFDSKPKS